MIGDVLKKRWLVGLILAVSPWGLGAQPYKAGDTIDIKGIKYVCYLFPDMAHRVTIESISNRFFKKSNPARLRHDVSVSYDHFATAWPSGYRYAGCILRDLISADEYALLKRNAQETFRRTLSCYVRTDWEGNVIDVIFLLPHDVTSQKILTPEVLSEWERRIKQQCKFPSDERYKDYEYNLWQLHLYYPVPCDRDPIPFLDSMFNPIYYD